MIKPFLPESQPFICKSVSKNCGHKSSFNLHPIFIKLKILLSLLSVDHVLLGSPLYPFLLSYGPFPVNLSVNKFYVLSFQLIFTKLSGYLYPYLMEVIFYCSCDKMLSTIDLCISGHLCLHFFQFSSDFH